VAELCYDPRRLKPSPDCALRAWGAFTAVHGRLGNSGAVVGVPAEPSLDELTGALGGKLARVGHIPGFAARLIGALRAAPAHTMVLVVVYPPGGGLGHVFWAYAAPVPGRGRQRPLGGHAGTRAVRAARPAR
jgi:hypothetical protein